MKNLGFLVSVSLGISAAVSAVPLIYPCTLPRVRAYCLTDPACVPAQWVSFSGGGAYVYLYQDGRAFRRMVSATACPDGTVQISFGAVSGQWLLSGEGLRDGARVSIIQE